MVLFGKTTAENAKAFGGKRRKERETSRRGHSSSFSSAETYTYYVPFFVFVKSLSFFRRQKYDKFFLTNI